MPSWLDGVADQFLEGSKSLICGIYKASPTAALAKLAGNAGFQPAQALTDAWNSACGAPTPPQGYAPGGTYGIAGRYYRVYGNAPGGNCVTGIVAGASFSDVLEGPLNISGQITCQGEPTQYTNTIIRFGVQQQNYPPLYRITRIVELNDDGTEKSPDLDGGGGYPPLTPQQTLDLQKILDQLSAIRNTQGLQTAALAGLGASAAANLAATAGVAAEVAAVAAEVAALAAQLAAISAAISALRALVEAIQDVLGTPAYNDLSGTAISTFAQACGSFNSAARRIVEDIGMPVAGYSIEGNNGVLADSIAGLIGYIASILGLSSRLEIDLCGSQLSFGAVGELLEEIVKGVVVAEPVRGLPVGEAAIGPLLCTVVQIAENLLELQGDTVIVQGSDSPVLRGRLLKLVWNKAKRYQQHAYLNIPNPVAGLTNESILAAAGPRKHGDWRVVLNFESRRQIQGWFESEAVGVAYLLGLAVLSLDNTAEATTTATHDQKNAPKKYLGVTMNCTRAFLVEESEEGGTVSQDFFPQRAGS